MVQRYDMCALCGVLLEEHWAEGEGGRRGRTLRVALLNRVLNDEWSHDVLPDMVAPN